MTAELLAAGATTLVGVAMIGFGWHCVTTGRNPTSHHPRAASSAERDTALVALGAVSHALGLGLILLAWVVVA